VKLAKKSLSNFVRPGQSVRLKSLSFVGEVQANASYGSMNFSVACALCEISICKISFVEGSAKGLSVRVERVNKRGRPKSLRS